MTIKNENLRKMLKEKGRQYVITMYINGIIHVSKKQLEYILDYETGEK